MNAFAHSDFIAHVSKATGKAYMLVYVDSELSDANRGAVDTALSMLSDDAREQIETEGGSVIEFGNIDDAMACFYSVERKLSSTPNLDLFVCVYNDGKAEVNLSQSCTLASVVAMDMPTQSVM